MEGGSDVLLSKGKRQVLLTFQVSSYCVLGSHGRNDELLSKHESLTQCWINVDQPSTTLAQH